MKENGQEENMKRSINKEEKKGSKKERTNNKFEKRIEGEKREREK